MIQGTGVTHLNNDQMSSNLLLKNLDMNNSCKDWDQIKRMNG